ncbi:MAG: hypothetical protein ACOYIT_05000 [Christensenellales bacterium]|jgi:hypothetical protein
MPIIPLIIMIALMLCGLIAAYIGMRIWKDQKISYIHKHHRENIKDENIADFSKKIGQAIILIGIGISITSLLFIFTQSAWAWAIFALCFIVGITCLFRTVRKYNK